MSELQSKLQQLKAAQNLTDLANILGVKPSKISYILYKVQEDEKYRTFEISKKSGGTRTIHAPRRGLVHVQRRLMKILYKCVEERQKGNPRFCFASHGFQKGRTIVSNAQVHRRRRYVFNLDLEDFFGQINFGRVRGFFIKDWVFQIKPEVATVIAQIACHKNKLPQGSPCSPIISNLIGNLLDLRLLALARDTSCAYTRYADDLTFSTNKKYFPDAIALNAHGAKWEVGEMLKKAIEDTGFSINPTKTRMSLFYSRQTVTGLVVNKKANINRDCYRAVRAMCHSVFKTGFYYKPGENLSNVTSNLNSLEGMLSHIYFVKVRRGQKMPRGWEAPQHKRSGADKRSDEEGKFKPPIAPINLYREFLLYKYFVAPKEPIIATEGPTDITHLKCAMRHFARESDHQESSSLTKTAGGILSHPVHFVPSSSVSREILNLTQGTGGQRSLIERYKRCLKRYKHRPMEYPAIILCDNDEGGKDVFSVATQACKTAMKILVAKGFETGTEKNFEPISVNMTQDFYYLGNNLYLVKVPEGDKKDEPRRIEDLFDPILVAKKLVKKESGEGYTDSSKSSFAKYVARSKSGTIDFSRFRDLLARIDAVIKHYAKLRERQGWQKIATVIGRKASAKLQ